MRRLKFCRCATPQQSACRRQAFQQGPHPQKKAAFPKTETQFLRPQDGVEGDHAAQHFFLSAQHSGPLDPLKEKNRAKQFAPSLSQ